MGIKNALVMLTPFLWEISLSFRSDMRVPARLYASQKMIEESFNDRTLEQLVNMTTLPGILGNALAMPDAHEGYGFPIGGVAAIDIHDGVISPGGIGYDINCGVKLLRSDLSYEYIEPHLDKLSKLLYRYVPSGVGRGGTLEIGARELDEVLMHGTQWMIENGYGLKEDLDHIESGGCLENANPNFVSEHAKARGRDQLGTMGAGNHFVEVDIVDQIFDEEVAKRLGLFIGQCTVLIHTGSRGLGHQVATDYIRKMQPLMQKYSINIPDRELACIPFSSKEGKEYFQAMCAAANFAFANRQMITWEVRKAWKEVFGKNSQELQVVYDVAHNIAKIEEYTFNNEVKKVLVHRKGATRAFKDQPVLIPGSMGTHSYVLIGTEEALKQSYGSSCHGAGRALSRHAAKKQVEGVSLKKTLESLGIHIQAGSYSGLAEEAPIAYKDVDSVVDVVDGACLAKKVVRLKPVAVIKG